MNYSEVLPTLKTLNRGDKLRVIQFLVNEVLKEEETFFEKGKVYAVYSPHESNEAAQQLKKLTEEQMSLNS